MLAVLALAVGLQASTIDQDIDRSILLWREYKLPIPPPSAIPEVVVNDKDKSAIVYGMVDYQAKGIRVLFAGSQKSSSQLSGYTPSPWSRELPLPTGYRLFPFNVIRNNTFFDESPILSMTVQQAALGRRDWAIDMIRRSEKEPELFEEEADPGMAKPVDNRLAAHTAYLIYCSILNSILDGTRSRPDLLRDLINLKSKELLGAGPALPSGGRKFSIDDNIRALRDTIDQPLGDEVQKAVNQLIELKHDGFANDEILVDPICQRILAFGNRAIAPLSDELDHARLTRSMVLDLGHNLTQIIPVNDVAPVLLQKLVRAEIPYSATTSRKAFDTWYAAQRKN